LLSKQNNKPAQLIHASGENVLDMYASRVHVRYAGNGATETVATTSAGIIDIDNSQSVGVGNDGEVRDNTFLLDVPFGSTDNYVIKIIHDPVVVGVNNHYIIREGENMVGGALYLEHERDATIDIMSYDTATSGNDMLHLVNCPSPQIKLQNSKVVLRS